MKYVKNNKGQNINFEAAVMLMDDNIREEIHNDLCGEITDQGFYDEYCRRHGDVYNEEFSI